MRSLLLLMLAAIFPNNNDIIYGTLDYVEIENLEGDKSTIDWYAISKAVAVIIPTEYLVQVSEDEFDIRTTTLQEEIENLAPSHPFRHQTSVGIGTAFLVAQDKVLTAGHLVKDLKSSVILFDYTWDTSNDRLTKKTYRKEEVYHLKRVIKKCNSKKGDMALIEIDKPINNRVVLELADFAERKGRDIKMISCPDGTPLKLTNHGKIWEKPPQNLGLSSKGFFIHNLDNSGGSSGAPIFDAQTGKVIGIQSGGDDNYVKKGNIIYQVKGDNTGLNTNIGRALSGEYGSKINAEMNAIRGFK